ncbi:DUF418 domain-containing protein [Spirosoma sp. BT702]|uniref:DUF418 domain-containing protein n=1 Tax=Spirosoma profusum TaxID=2771354 RepID=A0A926XVZ9_9BACT|nr:DUF418 domain-containing protein [Spirosoma profusum]MBD2701587.1 DUF418 domain-containing protein [Spirosoma profusum]
MTTSPVISPETGTTSVGQPWSHPVSQIERIKTIDIVRGVALLGILLMNIPLFGLALQLEHEPLLRPGSTDYSVFAVMTILFEGKMRALFSMLFGAGMLIFTSRKEEVNGGSAADFLYRRLLWMVLFGVIHEYVFLWVGDILFDYAICGLFLFPFRNLKPRQLLLCALICLSINVIKRERQQLDFRSKYENYQQAVTLEKAHKKLTDEQKKDKEAWDKIVKASKPNRKEVAEFNQKMRAGYGTIYKTLESENIRFHSTYLYLGLWDMLSMMFLGMALFKWGFFSNKLPSRTYWLTLLGGYGIGLPLSALGMYLMQQRMIDPVQYTGQWVTPTLGYDLQRALVGIGHTSLLILIYRSGVVPRLMKALENVGQMAFSNYVLQTICCTLFFNGYGLGYFGKLEFYQLYYVVAVVWTINLVFSTIWLQIYRFGPLEWVWRSLTYWQRQPIRRTATTA